jgi:hypothetical protein
MKSMVPITVELDDGDVRLYNATVSGGPMNLTDPETDWPFVWASYGVLAHELALAAVEST